MRSLHEIVEEFEQQLSARLEVLYDLKRAVKVHGEQETVNYIEGVIAGLSIGRESVEDLKEVLAHEHHDRWLDTNAAPAAEE